MKAIIVGGGVGGLTTALMLAERGIGCEVYEQASEIRELERLWLEELQPYDESGFNRRPRAL